MKAIYVGGKYRNISTRNKYNVSFSFPSVIQDFPEADTISNLQCVLWMSFINTLILHKYTGIDVNILNAVNIVVQRNRYTERELSFLCMCPLHCHLSFINLSLYLPKLYTNIIVSYALSYTYILESDMACIDPPHLIVDIWHTFVKLALSSR